jgi:SAM-dependent methyltransferase
MKRHRITGRVLVPGCGTGHDVRALAAQGADVVGLDIAESALRKAAAYPPMGGERYVAGDFLNPQPEHTAAYDWLVEHTCLCAINPDMRSAYARAVRRVLKPDGNFLAIFFRVVDDYTGDGPPHPISREAINELFGNDFEWVESSIPTKTYPSRPYGAEELCWMRLR